MNLYTLYMIDLDSVTIDQIVAQAVAPEVSEVMASGDGQVFPSFVTAGRIAPSVSFSTTGLTAALTKLTTDGFAIAAGSIANLFWRKRTEGGKLSAGADNIKMVVNKGICVPRNLSADQNIATLSADIIATWDGTNNPIVVTVASLAGTPVTDEQFVAGPAVINNVQLEGITSIEVDFGLSLTIPAHDGRVYPTYVAVAAGGPIITVRTLDALALSTFGIDGTAQGATVSEVYFRGKIQGGAVYANNVSEHIKITNTLSLGMITVKDVSADQSDDAQTEVKITPASAGILNPLSITLPTVIPGTL